MNGISRQAISRLTRSAETWSWTAPFGGELSCSHVRHCQLVDPPPRRALHHHVSVRRGRPNDASSRRAHGDQRHMAQLWCVGRVSGAKESDYPREECVPVHFDTPLQGWCLRLAEAFRLAQQLSPRHPERGSLVRESRAMRDLRLVRIVPRPAHVTRSVSPSRVPWRTGPPRPGAAIACAPQFRTQ